MVKIPPLRRAEDVRYHATVMAAAAEADILDLMAHTGTVAEIQNTLRAATAVLFSQPRAISTLG